LEVAIQSHPLLPPGSAPRIHDNLLTGARTGNTACDGINSFAATLRRWRNLGEFDAGSDESLQGSATNEQYPEAQQYSYCAGK